MLFDVLFVLGGLALLAGGAEGLVRGSASLAERLGLTPLVIGLTVVALGTSSPELVVSANAALSERGALALGNVVGSNIGNVAVILGLAVLIRPATVQLQLLRFDVPVLLGGSGLLALALLDGRLDRLEGAFFVTGLILYTGFAVRAARRESAPVRAEFAQSMPAGNASAGNANAGARDALFVLAGVGLLVSGAELLVNGAGGLGRRAGLAEAVIGLTIVALGTSLPELATSVAAAARGQPDIALGNVVGSNLFNIFGILGVASLIAPLEMGGLAPVDVGVMLLFTVLLLPLMRTGLRLERWEGGLLLGMYGAYLVYLLC